MQMVKKAIVYLLFIFIGMLILMPKQAFYYQLEQELSKEGIVISNEALNEGWFSLKITNASVYMKGIKIATIDEIDLFTVLFYSSASLENIQMDASLKSLFLEKIEKADLTYTVLQPFRVKVDMEGAFGEGSGRVDLKTDRFLINFPQVDKLGTVKRQFKKVEEGWQYETSF